MLLLPWPCLESPPECPAVASRFRRVIRITSTSMAAKAKWRGYRRSAFMATATTPNTKIMLTLPGDQIRQIQWRFSDRFDLQMLVQSSRTVARGTVARLVAAGERNTHEWTQGKQEMMEAFDQAGVTAAFMEPEEGGFIS